MAISVYLNSKLESVYLLWYLLTSTKEDIIAYNFYLPRREGEPIFKPIFAKYCSAQDNQRIDDIAAVLQKSRSFSYITCDLDNYDPAWCCIEAFELINASSQNSDILKIALSDTKEMVSPSSMLFKKAVDSIKNLQNTRKQVYYPLEENNLFRCDAVATLPSDLINLVDDSSSYVEKINSLLENGITIEDIKRREMDINSGVHPRYGVEENGEWFVDGDEYFGIITGEKSFLQTYPFYRYLTK